jgi:hypothetical protein
MPNKTILFSLYKFAGMIISPVKTRLLPLLNRTLRLSVILLTTVMAGFAGHTALPIPSTGDTNHGRPSITTPTQTLDKFIDDVVNGDADALVGAYSTFTFAFPIVEQPADLPAWIDEGDHVLTHFSLAAGVGSIGLLAHYEHAGKSFYDLEPDDLVYLVYGDGKTHTYRVTEILYYKAIDPKNASTSFLSLADQTEYTQKEVFDTVYAHPGRLVLQTCLVGDSINTWGRMFVIAEEETTAAQPAQN